MVVALGAHVLEALRLLQGERAEGQGDLNVHLVQDGRDGFCDLGQEVLIRRLHSSDNAELGGAGLGSLLRSLHQLRDVKAGGTHRGLEEAGLRAEVAILRAATGLDGDDALHGYVRAAPLQAGLVGDVSDLFQLLIGDLEDLQEFLFVEANALLEGLLACDIYDAHGRNLT